MYKHKLTIVDSELRDIFAGFIATGITQSYVDNTHIEEDKDEIARVAYEVSDAMIKRRKINKQKLGDKPID